MAIRFGREWFVAPFALGLGLAIAPQASASTTVFEALSSQSSEEQILDNVFDQDLAALEEELAEYSSSAVLAQSFDDEADISSTINQVGEYAFETSPLNADDDSIDQVTSVSQLRDVRPTDWAFQALQSLVERYGCIAGYPDGTYRGNRAMTRYEFAAGLNACLDRVNELIASATADLVTQEDLAVLQRLQEEFQAELATLRGRVDALEARTSELEANQFSTTTKLKGVAWMDLGSVFAGESGVGTDGEAEGEVTFSTRIRLALNTSFSGKDLLRTRLQAGGAQPYALRFENGAVPALFEAYPRDGSGNDVLLNELWYKFPLGKARVFVGTRGLEPDVIVPTSANLSQGYTFSDFFKFNPVSFKRPFGTGAGAGLNYDLTDSLNISAGYLANSFDDGRGDVGDDAGQAGDDDGLTGAANVAFTQLTFTPGDKLTLAGTYSHNYSPDGSFVTGVDRGTLNARRPFGNGVDSATKANNFGLNASYKLSKKLNVSGWAGWSAVEQIEGNDDADIFTWAVLLGFPDLFKEGNFGTLAFGATPYVTNSDGAEDDDIPYMLQAAYGFKVSPNITIKPQFLYLMNPNGSEDNDDALVGSLLTVFKF